LNLRLIADFTKKHQLNLNMIVAEVPERYYYYKKAAENQETV